MIPPKLAALVKQDVEGPVYSRGWSVPKSLMQPPFSVLNSRDFHASAVAAKRFAFLSMDDIGQLSLKENVNSIDGLLADLLVLSRGGELSQRSLEIEQRLRKWLSQNSSNLQIYPILSNSVRGNDLASYVSSEPQAKKILSDIASYLEKNGDAGIALNFEEMLPATQPRLYRFLQDLRRVLRPVNRRVILILPSTTERSWMQNFAEVADFILVPLYKEEGGRPEPLASEGWFESPPGNAGFDCRSLQTDHWYRVFRLRFWQAFTLEQDICPLSMVSSEKERRQAVV